jgi:hypothetical protein
MAINRYILYLQVFYTSDIADNSVNNLEHWVLKGQKQTNHQSKWEWSVELFTQEGHIIQPL